MNNGERKLKNIANCKPSEFLRQTNRIKKAVERWIDKTDFSNIRRNAPVLKVIPPNATDEEKKEIKRENKERLNEKAKENLSKILDNALEKCPNETLNVLGLLCFIEPENVDDYPISKYLEAFTELMEDTAVINFFTSFMRLALKDTESASEQ